jgi:hypothetical protein
MIQTALILSLVVGISRIVQYVESSTAATECTRGTANPVSRSGVVDMRYGICGICKQPIVMKKHFNQNPFKCGCKR